MLEKIIKAGIYLSLFIPLLVTKSTSYPFIFGKAIVFQILIEILLIFWLIWIIKNKRAGHVLPLQWSKLNIAVLIFFLVLILTTLTSLDPIRSFWSTQERMTGLFNLLHLGAYFLIISTVFGHRHPEAEAEGSRTKKGILRFAQNDMYWLLRISLLASAIVSIVALIQWGPRLFGTLGNPGFLACYLLFHIFFALFLIVHPCHPEAKPKDPLRIRGGFFTTFRMTGWRISYGLVLILNLISFYFARTRGAYLGLAFGLVAFVFLSIFSSRRVLALILLFVLLAALASGILIKKDYFLRASRPRIISWGISWNAFKDRPLLGWGPENYILAFAKHFDPEYAKYGQAWFDKAHNMVLEYAVTTGLLGLLAYLSLFVLAIKKSLFVAPLLIAYFITSLFWIDTLTVLIPFYITLALIENKGLSKS